MRINITEEEFYALNEAYEFILTNTESISNEDTANEMRKLLNHLFGISQKYKTEAKKKEEERKWMRIAKRAAPEVSNKELKEIIKQAKLIKFIKIN